MTRNYYRDNIPNKLQILKERHIQMRKPYQLQLVGLKTHPTIVPRSGFKLTTSRLHNVIMAKVSHALNLKTRVNKSGLLDLFVEIAVNFHCQVETMQTDRNVDSRSHVIFESSDSLLRHRISEHEAVELQLKQKVIYNYLYLLQM